MLRFSKKNQKNKRKKRKSLKKLKLQKQKNNKMDSYMKGSYDATHGERFSPGSTSNQLQYARAFLKHKLKGLHSIPRYLSRMFKPIELGEASGRCPESKIAGKL